VGPVKDQLQWQVWAYRLSEGATHLQGITLHTLYPAITPVLSGIRMPPSYCLSAASPPTMVAEVRRVRFCRTEVVLNTCTLQAALPGAAAAWAHASWDKTPGMSLHAMFGPDDEARLVITL
jgi:hypothetical protein